MNNEPVAWIDAKTGKPKMKGWVITDHDILLYTHPVKEQGNPVAWRSKDPDGYWSVYQSPVEGAEPLYTGFKELTDEEIGQIWKDCMESPYMQVSNPVGFARAILRKAQEK